MDYHTQFICKSFIISNNICPLETCKFHIKKESRLAMDKPTHLLVSANSWEACSILRAVLTKFYKLTAQEAASPNSKFQTGSEDSRNAVPSPLSFWYCCQLLVFCDLWGHHSKLSFITWYNSSVSQWEYSHIGAKAHIPVRPHHNSLSC